MMTMMTMTMGRDSHHHPAPRARNVVARATATVVVRATRREIGRRADDDLSSPRAMNRCIVP
jgi:hypothetical protein